MPDTDARIRTGFLMNCDDTTVALALAHDVICETGEGFAGIILIEWWAV